MLDGTSERSAVMSKRIPLHKFGQICGYTTVDDSDYEALSRHIWRENRGYVVRWESDKGKTVSIFMHREIMSCPKGLQVDHINHDRLDNRRENLRIVTNAQNHQNRKYSPFRGTTRDGNGWVGQCKVNGKYYRAGWFKTREEAAAAAAALRAELMPYATN